jgi:hypothetical protein
MYLPSSMLALQAAVCDHGNVIKVVMPQKTCPNYHEFPISEVSLHFNIISIINGISYFRDFSTDPDDHRVPHVDASRRS